MTDSKTALQAGDLSESIYLAQERRREILVGFALHGEIETTEHEVSPNDVMLLRDFLRQKFGDGEPFNKRLLARMGPNSTRGKSGEILSILSDAGIIKSLDDSVMVDGRCSPSAFVLVKA